MTETGFLAILAVVGTVVGAAISPLIGAIRDVLTSRSDAKSERLRSAAELAVALIAMANASPSEYDAPWVRRKQEEAVAARFALASHLPPGAGQVDRFIDHAIKEIARRKSPPPRLTAAHHSAAMILDWARGDRRPGSMREFEVARHGEEYVIA